MDSTVVARMKRADVIDNSKIQPGNVIVGLSSSGKATYESEYNGGMGSNGLTSARHDVFSRELMTSILRVSIQLFLTFIYTGTKSSRMPLQQNWMQANWC